MTEEKLYVQFSAEDSYNKAKECMPKSLMDLPFYESKIHGLYCKAFEEGYYLGKSDSDYIDESTVKVENLKRILMKAFDEYNAKEN